MKICVWCVVPMPFALLGVDDAKFAPPDDAFYKGGGVRDVLVLVPRNNGGCAEVPVDEAGNGPDGVMVTEKPQVISVTMGEELDVDHAIQGLMGTFHFPVD